MEAKPEEKSETKKENTEKEKVPNTDPQPQKPEEIKKRFVSINDLTQKENKINTIFSKFKKSLKKRNQDFFYVHLIVNINHQNFNHYSNMRNHFL